MKTAEQEFPELDKIATYLQRDVIRQLNNIYLEDRKAFFKDCPYPRQCILEMVIAKLEKCV
jgi:hypothetical protein